MRVATTNANAADMPDPTITARSPVRASSTAVACASAPPPTFKTSAHATPSGYGRSELVTRARRRGMEYITPNTPPRAQIRTKIQYGNPLHQPTITRPGSTKMIDESVPAAEATVWTILFSWIVAPLNPRSMAIEMTAAGIDVEKVSPALSPKNTFAAMNINVISTPRINPRTVNSLCCAGIVVIKCPQSRLLSSIRNFHLYYDRVQLLVCVCGNAPTATRPHGYRSRT